MSGILPESFIGILNAWLYLNSAVDNSFNSVGKWLDEILTDEM